MTCIAAIRDGGDVWIGADSAGVSNFSLTLRADPKIYQIPGFAFGFTSSYRMGQLLGYSLSPPPRAEGCRVEKYMATSFIDAVRGCLKNGGFAKKENEVETSGDFLVVHAGRIFNVSSDYQVGESIERFDACGCGQDIALASLYTSEHSSLNDRQRLELALLTAERFSIGVRGPFQFVHLAAA